MKYVFKCFRHNGFYVIFLFTDPTLYSGNSAIVQQKGKDKWVSYIYIISSWDFEQI